MLTPLCVPDIPVVEPEVLEDAPAVPAVPVVLVPAWPALVPAPVPAVPRAPPCAINPLLLLFEYHCVVSEALDVHVGETA
jgi:hypothetical protein